MPEPASIWADAAAQAVQRGELALARLQLDQALEIAPEGERAALIEKVERAADAALQARDWTRVASLADVVEAVNRNFDVVFEDLDEADVQLGELRERLDALEASPR